MKRIITLALLTFILIRMGVIEVPEGALAWISNMTAAPVAAQTVQSAPDMDARAESAAGEMRFPLQKPRGAFLEMVFDLFELKSDG